MGYDRGTLSTAKIWDEYIRDKKADKEMIPSRSFLKNRVLNHMLSMSKVSKARALDNPQYRWGGWQLKQAKAFKNVCPTILAELKPIPKLERADFKNYLKENSVPHKF